MAVGLAEPAVVPCENKHAKEVQQLNVRFEAEEVSGIDVLDRKEVANLVLDPGKRANAHGNLGVISHGRADIAIPVRRVL